MDEKSAGKPEKPGKRINAKRLAEDLDVSISTISRAFNKDAVIAPGTRSKILDYANQLGYRPNPYAQSLITQKSRIVGIIVSHLENPFYPEALRGLSEALREAGWHLMLFTVPSGETPDDILPLAISYQPEFVIVMAVTVSSRSQEVAERAGTKLIYFNRRDPDSSTFYVVCDNAHGGGMIADHFIDTGCRHLAYIAGFQNASTTLDRWRGFRDRCIARGFPGVWREEGYSFSYEAGYRAAMSLMKRNPRPDAIFCASDIIALGCIEAIRTEFGLRVPDDVSVAGAGQYRNGGLAVARPDDLLPAARQDDRSDGAADRGNLHRGPRAKRSPGRSRATSSFAIRLGHRRMAKSRRPCRTKPA